MTAQPEGQRGPGWDGESSDEEVLHPTAARPITDRQGRPVGEGVDPAELRRVIAHMPPGDAELAAQVADMAVAGAAGGGRQARDDSFVPARGVMGNTPRGDDEEPPRERRQQARREAEEQESEADSTDTGGTEANVLPQPAVRGPGSTPESRRFQGVSSRKNHRRQGRDEEPAAQPAAPPAQTGYPPMVYLHSAPDIGFFHGRRDDDWEKYKTKMLAHFKATGQTDEMAAEQFSRYMEGAAYQYWDTLTDHKKSKLSLIIRAFDKRYADEVRQEYFQHAFDTVKYKGYEDESMDDFAARIQTLASKGYPDYISVDGTRVSRKETRRIHVRRKFWECMTPDLKEQMYIFFQTREAPIAQQLQYARVLQAAKLQNKTEEQSYETVNSAQASNDPAVQRVMWKQLTGVIERQSKEIGQLHNMLEWQRGAEGSNGQRPPPTEEQKRELEQQRQRKIATNPTDEPGLRARTDIERHVTQKSKFDITKVKCHNCGEKGHMRRDCPRPQKPRNPNQARPQGDRREGGYAPRRREDSREGRRYDRRDESQGRRDRGDERRDSGRFDRSGEGRRSREWTPTRESRYGSRARDESEDRRERKTPMSTMTRDRVDPRQLAQEVVNILEEKQHQQDEYQHESLN